MRAKRVFLIVLDSVGAGAMPDAAAFGDDGAHTLKSVYETGILNIPTLRSLGIGNIDGLDFLGKTDSPQVAALVEMYQKRISNYVRFGITIVPDVRNTRSLSFAQQKKAEGEAIMRLLSDSDYVVLMDERGKQMRSVDFAFWMQKRMNSGVRRLVLMIGGPYGFSEAVYARANGKLSLSKMTFSHQIVRAIFTEQLYRAFTIIKGEPYHHE